MFCVTMSKARYLADDLSLLRVCAARAARLSMARIVHYTNIVPASL